MLNLHHLELFYYVARHGGIVQACRHIPYGVQQPAVSAQIIRLEEELGTTLFRRRPFQLTPAGRELFESIAAFFGNLPELEERLRGGSNRTLRLAGLTGVMRDQAPELLARMKKRHSDCRLTVQEASQKQAEQLILQGDADLAVTVLDDTLTSGIRSRQLARLPLVLWVKEDAPFRTASQAITAGGAGRLDLVSLGSHELLPRLFARGLKKLGRTWPISIQVSSTELVGPYVERGLGAGLTVATPHVPIPAGVRAIPLKGFPSLSVGAFWSGRLSPLATELLDDLAALASNAI
ncbi:MAG TPA: LysR family transcriptional regulator [Chthoniobacterales bacterium]